MLSLWAIVSTVHSANSVRIVAWIRSSVSRSTAAVASSRMRTLVFRSKARARHTNWRWPTLAVWKSERWNVFSLSTYLFDISPKMHIAYLYQVNIYWISIAYITYMWQYIARISGCYPKMSLIIHQTVAIIAFSWILSPTKWWLMGKKYYLSYCFV